VTFDEHAKSVVDAHDEDAAQLKKLAMSEFESEQADLQKQIGDIQNGKDRFFYNKMSQLYTKWHVYPFGKTPSEVFNAKWRTIFMLIFAGVLLKYSPRITSAFAYDIPSLYSFILLCSPFILVGFLPLAVSTAYRIYDSNRLAKIQRKADKIPQKVKKRTSDILKEAEEGKLDGMVSSKYGYAYADKRARDPIRIPEVSLSTHPGSISS